MSAGKLAAKLPRLCAIALLASCGATPRAPATATNGSTETPQRSNPPLRTVTVAFGDDEIVAEVADEHDERVLGLMHRPSLGADEGMLFVFPGKTSGGFWMKNTLIPLSIAYMERNDDGYEVLVLKDMEPCRADPCPDYPPGRPYDATLEVNRGWFEGHGVRPGDVAEVRDAEGKIISDLQVPSET